MNDERNEWSNQFTSNIGAVEFLRLGCAILIWIFIGVGLSVAFEYAGYHAGTIVITIFFIALFAFSITASMWRPAYFLLRKILGNKNLPAAPMPRSTTKISHQPRPWWSYLPGLWFGLLTLIVFYLAIKYFLR